MNWGAHISKQFFRLGAQTNIRAGDFGDHWAVGRWIQGRNTSRGHNEQGSRCLGTSGGLNQGVYGTLLLRVSRSLVRGDSATLTYMAEGRQMQDGSPNHFPRKLPLPFLP